MADEYKLLAHGGQTFLKWPSSCAACTRAATQTLGSSYSATTDAKYYVVRASWSTKPASIRFPVCGLHWVAYYLPMVLTGMSMGHKVLITLAALAFAGGITGLALAAFSGFAASPLSSYAFSIVMMIPLMVWWLAGQIAPVRISMFSPPTLWLRIRRKAFAREFERLNEVESSHPS